jgi:hypothetical protein
MSPTQNQLSFNNSGYYFTGLHAFVLPDFRASYFSGHYAIPLLHGIPADPFQIVNQNKW